jgi:hypothetical protein
MFERQFTTTTVERLPAASAPKPTKPSQAARELASGYVTFRVLESRATPGDR